MRKKPPTLLQLRHWKRVADLKSRTGYRLLKMFQKKYFSQSPYKSHTKEEVIKDLGECIAEGMDFEMIGMVVWYMNTSCDELNEATWESRRRGFKTKTIGGE